MNCRKASFFCLFVSVLFVIVVYMIYFNHGPPEKILSANTKTNAYLQRVLEGDGDEEVLRSARAWNSFIEARHYVSIGDIYDSCGKYAFVVLIKESSYEMLVEILSKKISNEV